MKNKYFNNNHNLLIKPLPNNGTKLDSFLSESAAFMKSNMEVQRLAKHRVEFHIVLFKNRKSW